MIYLIIALIKSEMVGSKSQGIDRGRSRNIARGSTNSYTKNFPSQEEKKKFEFTLRSTRNFYLIHRNRHIELYVIVRLPNLHYSRSNHDSASLVIFFYIVVLIDNFQ